MPQTIRILKVITIALYIFVAVNHFFSIVPGLQMPLTYLVLLLFIVHIAEYVIIKPKLDRLGIEYSHAFISTLLFGVLYWLPLVKKQI